jgi:arginyl-tRNA synthetase
MSKRKGNLLTIGEVVEDVGKDAVRFNLLTRSPESTIDFDLDLAMQESNDNPVYYVQYGHARICSILARAGDEQAVASADGDVALLNHPAELTLLRKLLELDEQIELAVDKLSPHNLTHYAVALTQVFNAFYRDCRVIDPDRPALSQARLLLARAAQVGLQNVLALLGVSAPTSM